MKNREFLITVDTEGDNLWAWKPGKEITTENTLYIPRFQELCEQYGFKPVYLTNYEMAMDDRWVSYAKQKAQEGKCEIGVHLHAWNTPPAYDLENRHGGNPYITEYPAEVMDQKVQTTLELLRERFGMEIITHRSGRWATNSTYFDILAKHGIKIDCSVTPQLDLSRISGYSRNCGNDYSKAPTEPHRIHPEILELPMSTRKIRHARLGSYKHRVKTLLMGDDMWLRPVKKSLEALLFLTDRIESEENAEYLQFMIHSSELMPGGSIYFKDAESVEKLYEIMQRYFAMISERGYIGQTMAQFAES